MTIVTCDACSADIPEGKGGTITLRHPSGEVYEADLCEWCHGHVGAFDINDGLMRIEHWRRVDPFVTAAKAAT